MDDIIGMMFFRLQPLIYKYVAVSIIKNSSMFMIYGQGF